MSARYRRDPRAERASLLVPGGARPRIVRDGRLDMGARVASSSVETLIDIEEPAFWVAAIIAAPDGNLDRWDRQVLGAARLLAGEAGVVAIGPAATPLNHVGEAGADRWIAVKDGGFTSMVAVLETLSPRHVIIAESQVGGDLARRTAARLGWSFQGDVEALSPRQAIRPCGGCQREQVAAIARILALPIDRAAPYAGLRHAVRPIDAAPPMTDDPRVRLGPICRPPPGHAPLAEAPFVMAAGQGVTDFAAFHALSRALGATEGASRVVCDAGLMPRASQVGASGTVLNARCYLAVGIAGAPQHLQGLGMVEHVVAVNTDLHAAMVARAGLSIIADAQAVMPALCALLRRERA